jgi:hypothetical protein
MYLAVEFPYNHPEKSPPLPWQTHLQVILEAAGHLLAVDIAPLLPVWTQPRGQTLWLTPAAKKLGLQPRKWEQAYLQQFKEPHPHLGRRAWRIPADAKTTPVVEVLTHLVIVALKQDSPATAEDKQAALQWVQHVVQDAVRRLVLQRGFEMWCNSAYRP